MHMFTATCPLLPAHVEFSDAMGKLNHSTAGFRQPFNRGNYCWLNALIQVVGPAILELPCSPECAIRKHPAYVLCSLLQETEITNLQERIDFEANTLRLWCAKLQPDLIQNEQNDVHEAALALQ